MAKNFELRNGHVFVLAEAAGGVYNGDQLRKISEVAEEDSAILKLTEDQRIGFMLAPERVEHVQEILAGCGVTLRDYHSGGPASPSACLGELCPQSQQDALGDSMEVAAALYAKYPDAEGWLSIGMNGCERNCLSSGVYDIHIVGESSGYKIYIGGRAREISQVGTFLTENVAKGDLPEILSRIVDVYYKNCEEGETLSDVTERLGFGIFMEALDSQSGGDALGIETDSALGDEVSSNEELTLEDAPQAEAPSVESAVMAKAKAMIEEDDLMNVPVDDLLQEDDVQLEPSDMELGADVVDQDIDIEIDDTLKERLDDGEIEISDDLEMGASESTTAPIEESLDIDVDDEIRDIVSLKERVIEEKGEEELGDSLGEEELSLDELGAETPAQTDVESIAAVDSLEEFTDLDEGSDGLQVGQDAIALDDGGALSGEGETELSDATAEDVERMTDAIRSEVSVGRKNAPEEPVATFEPPKPFRKPEVQGKLKLRMGEGEVGVVLPNGVECAIPLDFVDAQGSFEMEVGEETLSVEKSDKGLLFRYGALSLTVPAIKKRSAA